MTTRQTPHPHQKNGACENPLDLHYNTHLAGREITVRFSFASPRFGASGHLTPLRTIKTDRRFITRRTWRYASPPAPNHAQTTGRLITGRGSVPAVPNTPMTKGRIQLLLWKPIDQLYADWMRAIASADGPRPVFRLLDFDQGFPPCTTTKDAVFGCVLFLYLGFASPWAPSRPATKPLTPF